MEPGTFAHFRLGVAEIILGYPEQARQTAERLVALARKLDQPTTLGFALMWFCMYSTLRRDPEAILEVADECIAISREVVVIQPIVKMCRGWAIAENGDREEGMSQIEAGLAGYATNQQT